MWERKIQMENYTVTTHAFRVWLRYEILTQSNKSFKSSNLVNPDSDKILPAISKIKQTDGVCYKNYLDIH